MVPATLGEQLGDLLAGVLAGGGALLGPLLLASIGTAQWLVLRRHARGAALWIPANAAAWTAGLAVCFAVIAFTAEGRSVAVNVGIVVLAGLGMGATVATVTGVALVRLLNGRHRRSGPPRWVNRLVGSVLRSPAHRLLSDSLALLVVRGRRTGTPVTVPVMYARTGDDLIVLVGDAAAGNGGATCAAAPRSSSCSEGTPVPPAPTSSPRRTPVRER